MKTALLSILFLLICFVGNAQDTTKIAPPIPNISDGCKGPKKVVDIHEFPEEEAQFPCIQNEKGELLCKQDALKWYFLWNLEYPSNLAGSHRVYLSFVVQIDGRISDICIELDSGFKDIDAEAIRLVQNMPAWIPAKEKGEVVKSRVLLPIYFM